jgi:hypothetical protein
LGSFLAAPGIFILLVLLRSTTEMKLISVLQSADDCCNILTMNMAKNL